MDTQTFLSFFFERQREREREREREERERQRERERERQRERMGQMRQRERERERGAHVRELIWSDKSSSKLQIAAFSLHRFSSHGFPAIPLSMNF